MYRVGWDAYSTCAKILLSEETFFPEPLLRHCLFLHLYTSSTAISMSWTALLQLVC